MHVLLTGATGLVGQGVLHSCLGAQDVTAVTLLSRRPTRATEGRVAEIVLEDFADAGRLGAQLAAMDAALYCAGAPPVGTPAGEYRHVTLALTLAVAQAYAAASPNGRFIYISGAKSDPDSNLMALRVKGETERALQQLPITTVMMRPGGILPEAGTASPHGLLRTLHTLTRPLQGALVKGMPAMATTNAALGRAMLAVARMQYPPRVVENREINALGAETSA